MNRQKLIDELEHLQLEYMRRGETLKPSCVAICLMHTLIALLEEGEEEVREYRAVLQARGAIDAATYAAGAIDSADICRGERREEYLTD